MVRERATVIAKPSQTDRTCESVRIVRYLYLYQSFSSHPSASVTGRRGTRPTMDGCSAARFGGGR